jgi:F420-non-reducing hydrogenase large subunit
VAIVEAPRGTLTHHYVTDEKGLMKHVNLIVGTTNNYASMDMAIKKAARDLIKPNQPLTDGILNRIEMAFRSYDPCMGCATHAYGESPLLVRVYDYGQNLVQEIRRD